MKTAAHPKFVFRVARDNPWSIRPPRGDNRFDICDPDESVMTLYTGESAEAALAEVLAQFRPDLKTIAALDMIPSDDGRSPSAGIISTHWLATRQIGKATVRASAVIVDIGHPETINFLRSQPKLAEKATNAGFNDIDDSSLKASGPNGRRFTQEVAAFVYNLGHTGIRYGSRLGEGYHCVAGFISLKYPDVASSEFLEKVESTFPVTRNDPALQEVARIFGLRIK